MQCFARWHEDSERGFCFRDQTILQFGESWNLLASLVLLNPGSATPQGKPITDELWKRGLPYFVEPSEAEHYYEFRLDPLMRNILRAFSEVFPGGAIKIYNTFNLKNQDSNAALSQVEGIFEHPRFLDVMQDVRFLSAPVVFGPGQSAEGSPVLRAQLERYIEQVPLELLYGIQRVGDREFSAERVSPANALHSYHPSYSCTRGNKTSFARIKT